MNVNRQVLGFYGITEADYRNWCRENKKPMYRKETKAEFFEKIRDGKLAKNSEGKIVKCRKKDISE